MGKQSFDLKSSDMSYLKLQKASLSYRFSMSEKWMYTQSRRYFHCIDMFRYMYTHTKTRTHKQKHTDTHTYTRQQLLKVIRWQNETIQPNQQSKEKADDVTGLAMPHWGGGDSRGEGGEG